MCLTCEQASSLWLSQGLCAAQRNKSGRSVCRVSAAATAKEAQAHQGQHAAMCLYKPVVPRVHRKLSMSFALPGGIVTSSCAKLGASAGCVLGSQVGSSVPLMLLPLLVGDTSTVRRCRRQHRKTRTSSMCVRVSELVILKSSLTKTQTAGGTHRSRGWGPQPLPSQRLHRWVCRQSAGSRLQLSCPALTRQ